MRVTLRGIQRMKDGGERMKDGGERIAMVTAYGHSSAVLAERALVVAELPVLTSVAEASSGAFPTAAQGSAMDEAVLAPALDGGA